MFVCIAAGQLPLTTPQQVDETHFVFTLDAASSNTIVVGLSGVTPFPDGFSATVHLLWSGEGQSWRLLGCLKNTKPSAFFRLRQPAGSTADPPKGIPGVTATIGISIEPDALVDQQVATLPAPSSTSNTGNANNPQPGDTAGALVPFGSTPSLSVQAESVDIALQVAPKIAKNAFDYLSSFAPDSAPQTVPLLQKWLEQLERKLKAQGPSFLDKAV
ncbi:unnamed protein product [Tilletia laevis]|uniref:Uncharacterized protein n=2 Tax=Tilletia TaxID=13289 RepID=A0A177V8Q0_9BASI|nr:hypothetical protein CF336_g4373 [Tilletia laevis]KAE8260982.1 hypothetical protein A4X03_0g3645 [Tilletia caries]KAE8202288.1 hypothetical protein CF335_g3481 [Tilletia laevis]CAD6888152.1 unnamed protein product [Tilletia caries]CAD6903628.1 unnamed protein product [Tilletia laevis]